MKLFKKPAQVKVRYILAADLAKDFNGKAYNSLEEVAKATGKEIKESNYFSTIEPLDDLGEQAVVAEFALDAMGKPFIGPLTIDKGGIFFQTLDTKPEKDATLDEVRDIVKKRWARQNVKAKAKENAEAILAEIQSGADFAKAAKKYGYETKEAGPFKPFDEINEELFVNKDFSDKIFAMTDNGLLQETVPFDYGVVIAERLEYKPITEEAFEKEKENYRQRLLGTKKELAYKQLLERIKKESGFEINKNQNGQQQAQSMPIDLDF
jgi:parvulin-like peptidyl-prolyl isomerase